MNRMAGFSMMTVGLFAALSGCAAGSGEGLDEVTLVGGDDGKADSIRAYRVVPSIIDVSPAKTWDQYQTRGSLDVQRIDERTLKVTGALLKFDATMGDDWESEILAFDAYTKGTVVGYIAYWKHPGETMWKLMSPTAVPAQNCLPGGNYQYYAHVRRKGSMVWVQPPFTAKGETPDTASCPELEIPTWGKMDYYSKSFLDDGPVEIGLFPIPVSATSLEGELRWAADGITCPDGPCLPAPSHYIDSN